MKHIYKPGALVRVHAIHPIVPNRLGIVIDRPFIMNYLYIYRVYFPLLNNKKLWIGMYGLKLDES